MDAADGFAKDGGSRELNDFGAGFSFGGEGDGVTDDDFFKHAVGEALNSRARENGATSQGCRVAKFNQSLSGMGATCRRLGIFRYRK